MNLFESYYYVIKIQREYQWDSHYSDQLLSWL